MNDRCTVCQLPAERLTAINDALRAGIPLGQLTGASGVSKSTLSRHWQHAKGPTDSALTVARPAAVLAVVPPKAPEPVRAVPSAVVAAPTKEQLLSRIEMLWDESLDGLNASKEAITVHKPNGETFEIQGDLRARSSFLREARGVVELAGMASGHFQRGDAAVNQVNIQIVCPVSTSESITGQPEITTIDIGSGR